MRPEAPGLREAPPHCAAPRTPGRHGRRTDVSRPAATRTRERTAARSGYPRPHERHRHRHRHGAGARHGTARSRSPARCGPGAARSRSTGLVTAGQTGCPGRRADHPRAAGRSPTRRMDLEVEGSRGGAGAGGGAAVVRGAGSRAVTAPGTPAARRTAVSGAPGGRGTRLRAAAVPLGAPPPVPGRAYGAVSLRPTEQWRLPGPRSGGRVTADPYGTDGGQGVAGTSPDEAVRRYRGAP